MTGSWAGTYDLPARRWAQVKSEFCFVGIPDKKSHLGCRFLKGTIENQIGRYVYYPYPPVLYTPFVSPQPI